MAHAHSLKRILLNLARSKQHPDGSARHGYDLVAPLDAEGRLDPSAWHDAKALCRVRRFWAGEPDMMGHLVHRAGGAGGATWLFDYDATQSDDDEAGYRLAQHVFRPGEYVSVRDDEGEMHTFKVVTVTAA
ncbi:hypothetical protein NK718_17390 [Alsobacter sp. SYSU M60028]|uniref:Uncharacterized protein n=1 Tax=Alsobacter ponti TaxID=2962936 RepID=A0ABT1LGR5_9HYPH|nr:hypothetical protein [Alsobacter ponti]MCP8940303.1 hypothetical protein [Alsobacter ponti]